MMSKYYKLNNLFTKTSFLFSFCREITDILSNGKNLVELKEEVDRLKEFFLTNYRVVNKL